MWAFEGNRYTVVVLGEIEFDIPGLDLQDLQSGISGPPRLSV